MLAGSIAPGLSIFDRRFSSCPAPQISNGDVKRGFIRAEVVHYDDFVQYGSDAKCREHGKLRLEGKEYVVKDGDIIHFRFNV